MSMFFVWLHTKYKRNNVLIKIIVFFGIVLPIILLECLRYDVGTDYLSYERYFFKIANNEYRAINEFHSEFLFIYEVKLLYFLFGNAFPMFVFHACLINTLFYFVVYDRKGMDLVAIYAFFYLTILPVFFNVERQGIAVLLVWLALKKQEEKKLYQYVFIMILAIGYHTSALLFVPMYLINIIYHKKVGKKIKSIIYLMLIAIPVFMGNILSFVFSNFSAFEQYERYSYNTSAKASSKSLFIIALLIIAIFIVKIVTKSKKDYSFYIILSIISCICCFIDMYYKAGVGTRLLYYSQYGIICLIGYACGETKYQGNRLLFRTFFISASFYYYYYIFYYQTGAEIFPYRIIKLCAA